MNVRAAMLHAVLLSTASLLLCISAAAQGGLRLLTVDRDSELLSSVDVLSGVTMSTVEITLPPDLAGFTVDGATGLAKDPITGELYALLRLAPGGGVPRRLVIIDPVDGGATDIGDADNGSGLAFADIAFSSDGVLYGVTGEGGPTRETLYTLNKSTGAATLVKALGNGDSGEAIIFHPGDNLLYHASGFSQPVFEKLDATLPSLPLNIPLAVEDPSEATSLLHLRGDFFLWANVFEELFLVNKNGSARLFTFLDHVATGIVLTGNHPPCPPNAALYGSAFLGSDGPALLYSINPATGGADIIGPTGLERVGALAFRSDGILFGIGERMDGSDTTVLSTMDPCTGLSNEVAAISGSTYTDLSFRPSDNALFAMSEDEDAQSVRLSRLDPGNGQTLSSVLINIFGFGNGIAFSPDPGNALFHADDFFLSTLNPADGSILSAEPLSFVPPDVGTFSSVEALDFQPGTGELFGIRFDGITSFLARLETSNGEVTTIGTTQSGLDGLAFARTNVAPSTADLEITNVADADPITAGNILTYTIVVTNKSSTATAHNVVVSDQLPSALRNASASPLGSCSQGTNVICQLGSIAPGGSVTVTVSATVVVSASGTISNTASVRAASTDPTPGNNAATATTNISLAPTTDLAVTSLTHPATPTHVAVGTPAEFTAVATNNGGSSADAKLTFAFPVNMSSLSTLANCVLEGTTITCDLGTLAPMQSASVTIRVSPPFGRSIQLIANVLSASTNDTDGSNNFRTDDSAVPLQVRPRPFARQGQELRLP